jgi:hypothetical protein
VGGLKRIPMRADRTRRDLGGRKNGLAVSRKNRPHIDRNLFAIHPVATVKISISKPGRCMISRCFVSYAEFDGA